MSSTAYVIRFPDGDYEYSVGSTRPPVVGLTITRRGAEWRVTEIVESRPMTVYVTPVPAREATRS
jgi:hypothetical protein